MTPLDALQATLAAEHAAVYLTGVLGAQTSQSKHPALYRALLESYRTHRRRRDQVAVLISARGGVPVASEVAYDLPALGTVAQTNDAALQLERRIATTYGQLIENTTGIDRRWALVALESAAVVQLEYRGTPELFPGSSS